MRMEENRKYVRWQISRPVRFNLLDKGNKNKEEERLALLKDVSFAGVKLSLSENLRLNDRLSMYLEIPDEDNPVHCEGRVVWQKNVMEPGGYAHFVCGLSFSQLKDRDKEKIFQYIRGHNPEEVREKWWEGIK